MCICTKCKGWNVVSVKELHRECFVCGTDNSMGIKLEFLLKNTTQSEAKFIFPHHTCGYPNRIQGGVVSAILDSAMANVFILQNVIAYTVQLNTRFLKPVKPGVMCSVKANLLSSKRGVHCLDSVLTQEEMTVAVATAKFMEQTREEYSIC